MAKVLKCFFAFATILLFSTGLSSFRQNNSNSENKNLNIQNVSYSPLPESVENEKENDTINKHLSCPN